MDRRQIRKATSPRLRPGRHDRVGCLPTGGDRAFVDRAADGSLGVPNRRPPSRLLGPAALYFSMASSPHAPVAAEQILSWASTVAAASSGQVDTATDPPPPSWPQVGRPSSGAGRLGRFPLLSSTRPPWHMISPTRTSVSCRRAYGPAALPRFLTQKKKPPPDGKACSLPNGRLTKHSFHLAGAYTDPELYFDATCLTPGSTTPCAFE